MLKEARLKAVSLNGRALLSVYMLLVLGKTANG